MRPSLDVKSSPFSILGPVVCISPFTEENEVIGRANNVPYGLSATLWTQDVSRLHRLARQFEVLTVVLWRFKLYCIVRILSESLLLGALSVLLFQNYLMIAINWCSFKICSKTNFFWGLNYKCRREQKDFFEYLLNQKYGKCFLNLASARYSSYFLSFQSKCLEV